jgi:hypothetical protein
VRVKGAGEGGSELGDVSGGVVHKRAHRLPQPPREARAAHVCCAFRVLGDGVDGTKGEGDGGGIGVEEHALEKHPHALVLQLVGRDEAD